MGSIYTSPAVVKAENTPYFTPANNAGAAVNPDDPSTPTLFKPLQIRNVTLKNRIIVSPMCMYSAEPNPASPFIGAITDYHIAHLGQFALKGAGLVFIEAQAVQPNGRLSPHDLGLWQEGTDSEQFKGLQRLVQFAHSQGAKVAVQLAHAGRKGSVLPPWIAAQAGQHSLGADESVFGWPTDVVGPCGGEEQIWDTAPRYWAPRALSTTEIKELVQAFAKSAALAVKAGVDVIELHGAHGYLLNQFLSPVTNKRTDEYGGSFENRVRIVREVATAVRAVIPEGMPLFLRISVTDWLEGQPVAAESGSWDLESSLRLVEILPELGIDLVDVSSGGIHKDQKIKRGPGYQVDLAGELRKAIHKAGASTLVGGVGLITEAEQARGIVQGADEAQQAEAIVTGSEPKADVVLLARQFLREPEWVILTAKKLGVEVTLPHQFWRAL
ncbi:hypothetical protein BDV28DRAFT_135841 [Aspergillus coremiiformis]|uniref:NADH:flavin oxidoreductase/NADH oxidase N-terminal domain-containing protein n=1 Tax=Aspergillus coremiiformis TaxID=138285 RepID=A0A5N6Z305_9EURO|nr:hypothetical protein BDV28DRAFT_135841 [Aspergillus coremiiformis]